MNNKNTFKIALIGLCFTLISCGDGRIKDTSSAAKKVFDYCKKKGHSEDNNKWITSARMSNTRDQGAPTTRSYTDGVCSYFFAGYNSHEENEDGLFYDKIKEGITAKILRSNQDNTDIEIYYDGRKWVAPVPINVDYVLQLNYKGLIVNHKLTLNLYREKRKLKTFEGIPLREQ